MIDEDFEVAQPPIPKQAHLCSFSVAHYVLSPDQCAKIISIANDSGEWKRSEVVNGSDGTEGIDIARTSSYIPILNTAENEWIYQHVGNHVNQFNMSMQLQITGMAEAMQLIRYQEGEYYDWHVDIGGQHEHNKTRKISYVVQLSSPSEFDGPGLQIFNGPKIQQPEMFQGSVCMFPSYVLHRAAPVERGTRYVLVGWVSGNRWQ